MRKEEMMRMVAAVLVLGLGACGQDGESREAGETPTAAAPAPQSTPSGTPAPMKAGLLAVPEDKGELQRMIDLGYTPHADHLHPPGMNECPMGGDMIQ